MIPVSRSSLYPAVSGATISSWDPKIWPESGVEEQFTYHSVLGFGFGSMGLLAY